MKTKLKVDTSYNGAVARALRNCETFGDTYYVRPDAHGGFCVSTARPDTFTVAAMRKLHDDGKAELRNMENWPVHHVAEVAR